MPYAEVTRALEQEAQMYNPAARSASPCRLSPREVSAAAPQPDRSAARSSVPPGKYCSSGQWLLPSTYRCQSLIGHVLAISKLLFCFSAFHQLYLVEIHWAPGKSVLTHVYCDIDWLFSHKYKYFIKILSTLPPAPHPRLSQKFKSLSQSVNVSLIIQDAKGTYDWLSVMSIIVQSLISVIPKKQPFISPPL